MTSSSADRVRIAFVNTRMPGINTFLIRDLRALLNEGVNLDLYLFDVASLDAKFREEVESHGGLVRRIAFPITGGVIVSFLRELFVAPVRLAGSMGLALRTLPHSPAEALRSLAVLPAAIHLSHQIRARETDQVHALWAGVPATVGLWIARHARIGFSFSAHAWDLLQRTALLDEKVRRSTGLLVCSDFARRSAESRVRSERHDRIRLVHHGLELTEWPFSERRDTRPVQVIAVGRLMPKKGFEYLVEAMHQLSDEYRCAIIGPSAASGAVLERMIRERGLTERVHLVGSLGSAEVRERMTKASVLCCPSVESAKSSDGIPNVVLEAMALGTPVVATDAGGLAEVVRPSTGILVPQHDASALAQAIAACAADWPAAWQRARNARELIENDFDVRKTVPRMLEGIGLAHAAPIGRVAEGG